MIFSIPIDPTDPSFVQEATLDGRTYRMLFRWNDREAEWYLSLSDLNDGAVAPSRKLVAGADLLRHVADYDRRPPGSLMLLGVATRANLGTDAQLVYLDEAEVAA